MENNNYNEEVEELIKKKFEEEETKQDKEFYLKEINKVISELYRSLE